MVQVIEGQRCHTKHNLIFLCHREEEEDKLIGAMLKKKGRGRICGAAVGSLTPSDAIFVLWPQSSTRIHTVSSPRRRKWQSSNPLRC